MEQELVFDGAVEKWQQPVRGVPVWGNKPVFASATS